MRQAEQIAHFEKDLNALLDRFRSEYDLPYAAVVGVLHMTAFKLCQEAMEEEE